MNKPECLVMTLMVLMVALAACAPVAAGESEPNTLTDQEKAEGWQLLFDGESASSWRPFGKSGLPSASWNVAGGWLIKKGGEKAGNIVTDKQFTDFEFSWEWRIAEGGNNGVKYFVDEERGELGHEYQMLGEKGSDPGKGSTAGFYEVLAPRVHTPVKLAPEVNHSRIVVRGDKVQHWLNGELVLAYACGSEEVNAGVASSKFKGVRDFGKKLTARIMLTDHGSECAFRNLRVREFPAK